MSGAARYAIYYAPPADTPIWAFGSSVLGYDAANDRDVTGFLLPGYSANSWRALNARPRTYGFHATLKAPFRLVEAHEQELQIALDVFAQARASFRLGAVAVASLAGQSAGECFVALTPTGRCDELDDLERDVVRGFDRFRKPLTTHDRLKRTPDRLTARQREYLDNFGYPFILEDFQFHMTLTGLVADATGIADALADAIANSIGTVDLRIDDICLFRQLTPVERFTIISRHALKG